MKVKLIILSLLLSINSYAVTYNLDNGMSQFESTMDNYFNNKYWITDWNSFQYTAWDFTDYTNVGQVNNLFNSSEYNSLFIQLNIAKSNSTLTDAMKANFYQQIEEGITQLNLYSNESVPLEFDFLSMSLFCIFILFIKIYLYKSK